MINKKLVEAFILECKQEQEWKEKVKDNYIEFDYYFKYSGRIEKTKEIIDHYYSHGKYGVMLEKPILRSKDPIVRWYFQNPNESMVSIAIKFNISYREVSRKIGKYLKTRTDDKGNKIFA